MFQNDYNEHNDGMGYTAHITTIQDILAISMKHTVIIGVLALLALALLAQVGGFLDFDGATLLMCAGCS